jgi:type IV pilus assembly protein PilB
MEEAVVIDEDQGQTEGDSQSVAPSPKTDSILSARKHAVALGVPFLEEAPKRIDESVLGLITEETARRYAMAVFAREGDVVQIAMTDPENFESLNILRFLSEKEQLNIEISLTSEEVLQAILGMYTTADSALSEAILSLKKDDGATGVAILSDGDIQAEANKDEQVMQDAPIARLVEAIIKHSIESKASDIHIEPAEGTYRVRFRVDGVLHASLVFPIPVGKAVVSRIKILCNMKIDEKRKPQDGRFRAEHAGKVVDLRVSTFPVVDGEKVVIRVLDKNTNVADFKEMGLWGKAGDVLKRKIMEPHGIILMTGPTGSGKSTTLYSFLKILNQEERNIVTLEDPVEYQLLGVNQSQVMPEIGYTFASGLRSILRQDPNVIMVGEIRDGETAELAIHAALTGHLVLSTLHTNDSIGAIPRLVDMGIAPFLLASSIQVVAAQRLVRRICGECKGDADVSPSMVKQIEAEVKNIPIEEVGKYGYDPKKKFHLYEGKGCDACGGTGYKGRIAIFEAFDAGAEEIRRIIADENGNAGKIADAVAKQGMITIRQDGLLKALLGMTTITEIERVTEGALMVDEG